MDSPHAVKKTSFSTATADTAASSESPPVQESPFFSYVNNLSPIKSVKASRVVQDFLGLSTPPIVFTSPRINPHRGSQFLERPQCSQSASVEISPGDNGGKILVDDPDDSNKSCSLQLGKFVTDNQKDLDINNDANTQHCSSSLCVESVDEYLADPADVDCMYSGHSVNPDVKQSNDTGESSLNGLTHSKETISNFDDKNGPGDKVEEPLILSEESKNNYREILTFVDEPGKVGGQKIDVQCANLESTMYANLAFEKQRCDDSIAQCAGYKMQDRHDCTSQLMLEPLQDVQECEDCSEMGPTSYVSEQNILEDASKVSQKHRGLRRRCLQFEEATSNAFGSLNSSPLPTHVPEDSVPSATSSDSKDLKPPHVALNSTSSEKKMVKLSKPITSLFPPRCSGNFPVTGSKPSGIGLHLNSIVNAMPHGRAALTGMRLAEGCTGSQGVKSLTSLSFHNVSSNMDRQSSIDNEDERHESNASTAAGFFSSECPSSIEPPNLLIHAEDPASVLDERKLSSVGDGNFEDSSETSPKKKKKRISNTTDDDSCKRCNCKKSKCLKLYCDCFAAGLYCAESCACQGCFNRPEYEDCVVETRQQIESRNPLAFAPKIVQGATDFPSNNTEDANLTTPSSARHKRGCNCKKSMCLKKYCECYQANVGCSTGCRCEGCMNVYGRKEDYVSMERAFSEERMRNRLDEGTNSTLHNKPEMTTKKTDLFHGELYDLHRLSPLTPSLQCSDHGKQAANFRARSGKYLSAPESDVNVFPPHAKFTESPKNSESSLVLLETSDMSRNASYDWQQDCNNVENEIMNPSSPRCNSVVPSKSASFSSKTRDQAHIPHSILSQGSSRPVCGGSLRWRSSPITPMTKLGETKSQQCHELDSKLHDIPDMLKEASTPSKSVKASSPKQKRISPPQSHLRELGSSSSGALRSGRKFILKAVPSFPPLTPCVDSKRNDHDDSGTKYMQVTDDLQS